MSDAILSTPFIFIEGYNDGLLIKTYGYEMHDIKRFVSGVNKNLWKEGINFPTRVFRPYAIQYYTFLALLGHVGLSQVITNLYRLRYV